MQPTASIDEPRLPSSTGLALFDHGSRVFFFLAALYGAVAMGFWIPIFVGMVRLPTTVSATLWHAHELIYGFGVAGVAGFLLTAVPRWTGTPARHGPWLMALAAIWLLDRIAMFTMGWMIPPWLSALGDLVFLPALALSVAGPLRAATAGRNLALFAVVAVLWCGDLAMHAEFAGWAAGTAARGARVGIDVLLVVMVIGARMVPAFTTDATRGADAALSVPSFSLLDRATVAAMALLAVSDAAIGLSAVTGVIALAAALLCAIRLGAGRDVDSPIPWVLTIGYAWLAVGLALRAAAALGGAVPEPAALHALTAGAIATMLVAVISRAALGHAAQPLKVRHATIAACALLSLAAALRVVAPFAPGAFEHLLAAAGTAWTLAFLLVLGVYTPILVAPRAGSLPR